MAQINMSVSSVFHNRVTQIAKEKGLSPSAYSRMVLIEHINTFETEADNENV